MNSAYSPRRRGAVLACLFLAWLVGYADRIAISTAIVPISREFALDARAAGYVLSAFYVSYAVMQIAGGWMAHRFGARRILLFCVFSWSLFTSLTGQAWSLASLVAVRLLFGIGEGGFSPASSVTIAEVFPRAERARAKSFVISSVLLGGAVGSGVAAAAISQYGWRATYHWLGLVGIGLAGLLWLAIRPPVAAASAMPPRAGASLLQVLRIPMVRKTSMIWFLKNMGALGMQAWMPTYLMRVHHVDLLHAGLMAALPYLLAFLGLNGVGWLLDKAGQGRERLCMAASSALGVAALAVVMQTDSLVVLMACWVLSTLSYNFVYATVFAIPLKRLPDEMVGNATGLINFGGQLAGAIAPAVMGLLIARFQDNFQPAFGFLLATGIAAFLLSLGWRPAAEAASGSAAARWRGATVRAGAEAAGGESRPRRP
ncbi:MFS transporter [Cupriavidus malaysiensis]|uniref:MFS transporter n=1 Tax=Cupriavidus malaysiensis TaxID=367825 RepID=A0ABN4TUD2_9BURK|nr:MFS transporter [Cupriavidus malaysiensis]AOZ09305.1 MFS transporter [Cupriavidus malaysiensis]